MRRRAHAFLAIALAGAVGFACSEDYSDAPVAPAPPNDAGATSNGKDAGPVVLEPSNPPGVTLGTVSVARGESTRAGFVVTRGDRELPLDLVASGLPPGITVATVRLPTGTTKGEIEVGAAVTAAEGSTKFDLALLEGNTELAKASVILEVGPLRAGNLDPDFGKNGVVDLDLPRSLLAFSPDGTLYVNAPTGLTRWLKDGTKDAAYGPLANLPLSFTPWTMLAENNGQVHLGGYSLEAGGAKPVVYRSVITGKGIDGSFGVQGKATVPSVPSTNGLFNTFAIGLTPTALYAFVKLQKDGLSNLPGSATVARLSLGGEADLTYGTNGYRELATDPAAPEHAFFESIGVDRFVVALPDRASNKPSLRVFEGQADRTLVPRLIDYGTVTAAAWDPTTSTSLVARESDEGLSLLRIGDAGVAQSSDAGATVNAISVDTTGRPLLSGCAGEASSWVRYLPDGGVDPTYRHGSTPEMSCVLTAQVTEKYIYLAGLGGTPSKLRLARLVR